MTKQSYSSSVNDAFDRTYSEVYSDDYLAGVRPDDPPRIGLFWIGCAVAVFAGVCWVAVHIF